MMKQKTILHVLGGIFTIITLLFFITSFSPSEVDAAPTVTRFWVSSVPGNWSNGANWSLSNGGVSCGCVPGVNDVVGFTSSANGAVTIDAPVFVNAILASSGFSGQITNTNQNISIASDLEIQTNAMIDFGSGNWNIGDDIILTSGGGSPILNLNSADIFVGGDWANTGGVVNSGTSTVQFDGLGLNQNIFGNNTFYNVIIDPLSTKFFGFQENSTTIFAGGLIVTGVNAGNKVHIQTVNAGGIPVKKNATITPQGSVTLDFVTVQYNINNGTTNPLTSLSDEVVEVVPFSTSGWFPTRGPGGIISNIETWSLVDSVPLNNSLLRVSDGEGVRRLSSIFGGTIIEQDDTSKQPVYTSGAFNFNPALTFDGIDDVMYSPDGWTSEAYYFAVKTDSPVTANLEPLSPSYFAVMSWLENSFEDPAGAFVLGGQFTSMFGLEVITHAVGGGTPIYRSAQKMGPGQSNLIAYEDIPNIYASIENEAGDYQDLFGNGKSVGNFLFDTHYDFSDLEFFLGSYLLPSGGNLIPAGFFKGQIGELISFTQRHDDNNRQKVLSYLALKYGTTLDQSDGGQDYVSSSSNNNKIWSFAEAGPFNQDIAGIGQDNASALYQPKSRSVNKDSIFTIGDPSDLENMEFLFWANNGDPYDSWLSYPEAPQGFSRIQRVWDASRTGNVGETMVYVDPTNLPPAPGALYLLVSTNPNNFSNASVRSFRMKKIGDQWQLEDPYTFGQTASANGSKGEYFTIGHKVIEVEFKDASLSSPEDTPVDMTQVYVKGEVSSPFSFGIIDKSNTITTQPKATAGSDYTFTSPQMVTVPIGDYRTNLYPVDLNLTIIPDNLIESDELTTFMIPGLPAGVALGDIDGDTLVQGTHNYLIINDDSAGVVVSPTSLEIAENDFGEYTIVLTSEVTADTQVTIDIVFGSQLEESQGSGILVGQITFTPDNWNIPQIVPVWAQEDGVIEGIHFDTVTHTISDTTTDPNYLPIENIQQVDVTIYDNDLPPVDDDEPVSTGSCTNPNGCINQGDDDGDDVEILGCMDPVAVNYLPSATQSDPDEPCLYVLGETDPPSGNDYVEDALSGTGECPYFSGFYRLGSEGSMVARWQAFLNVLLGTNLTIDGKFGHSTDIAVKEYHEQWADVILRPWGHTTPTGYIYKTTNATGNSMIGCPLGTLFISETGEYFNADTYNSNYNLQALTQELRNALNIESAQLLDGYSDPTQDYTQ